MSERTRIRIGRLLVLAGILFLTYWIGVHADAWLFQRSMSKRLDKQTAESKRKVGANGLIGRIEIPSLGLSAVVLEGTGERTLQRGVGHVERTAFPGERGNVALAAHRDTYFGKLGGLENGDMILIRTSEGTYAYQVEKTLIVPPTRGDLLNQMREPTLTLVTCYPFRWIGPAPKRFVVRARQVESYTEKSGKSGRSPS